MSLITDDIDIRDARLFMEFGGNGDYYINLMEIGKKGFNSEGKLVPQNIVISLRVSMSGGRAPHEVRMAVVHLFRMLEQFKLNDSPRDEIARERKQANE